MSHGLFNGEDDYMGKRESAIVCSRNEFKDSYAVGEWGIQQISKTYSTEW